MRHGRRNGSLTMQLHYQCKGQTVPVDEPRRSLLEISISARIPHWCECGGHGRCTTCRVEVIDGADNLTPQTAVERRMADLYGWGSATRLGCQARLLGDVTIERLVTNGGDATQLQIESLPNRSDGDSELAVLICNLRQDSNENGTQSAADMVDIMDRYLAAAREPILLNNGVIQKNVGTTLTGLFGHAGDTPQSACRLAARAGFGIADAIGRLNRAFETEGHAPLAAGIGIHHGPVVVSRVGHPSLQQVSLAGATVEAAGRLQALAPSSGAGILFSETVRDMLPAGTLAIDGDAPTVFGEGDGAISAMCATALALPDPMAILQETLDTLFEEPEGLAHAFYNRLFAEAPQLRALFSSNMASQILAIDHMLRSIVYALARPEQLSMGLVELGRRHTGYGVKPEHYDIIRAPLLNAVDETLGADSTPEKIAAWQGAIDQVLAMMNAKTAA